MKFIYSIVVVMIMLSFNACKSSEDPVAPDPDPAGNLKVKGIVLLNGEPVQGALISIDDVVNWRSTSSSDGSFEINGVSKGNHIITARKTLEEGKVVAQSAGIVIELDINDIGFLDLPAPLSMNSLDPGQVTPLLIPLSWNELITDEFVEYKLYRKDVPGLDEATGELIFTSTNISEVSYNDADFRTGRTYYYRVYAYLQNGKIAGSNIVSATIPEVNLITNPDFEASSGGTLPDEWTERLSGTPEFNYFKVTNDNVKNGSSSLRISYIDSLANPDPGFNPWGGLYQTISSANLKPGEDYTISFWTRSEIGYMQVRLVKNGDFEQPVFSYIVPNDLEWTEHSVNFQIDAETSYIELWVNTRSGFAVNGIVKGWIDNMKIVK